MPIHGILTLAWAVLLSLLAVAAPNLAKVKAIWRAASVAAMIVLAGCIITYGITTSSSALFRVAILFGSSVAGAVIMVWAWFWSGQKFDLTHSNPLLLFCC